MIDDADTRFFTVLNQLCDAMEGVGPDCRAAVAKAVETRRPDDMRKAREAVSGLAPPLRESLLRETHRRLATDLSAIWDARRVSPDPGPLH